ncbi:MAG: glycosyltransferase family 2 protein [Myxococcota bacterium]
MIELSLILPCYNEGPNVDRAVQEAFETAKEVASAFEIVVVDDGSADDTADRARALQKTIPELVLVQHPVNRGYGAALRTGFRAARFPWVFYTDGDAQFDSRQLCDVVDQVQEGAVLAGYRSPRQDHSVLRTGLGRAWTFLANASLGLAVADVNCAFKVFPKALLDAIPMESQGAAIDAEILAEARHRGLPIRQVPVAHRPRVAGRATGARADVMLLAVWELARVARRLARQPQTRLRPVRLAS